MRKTYVIMSTKPVQVELLTTANAPAPPSKFDRLFAEYQAIEAEDAWKSGEVGFINRILVQATLPYREPKGDPPVWGRRAGNYSLVIQPGGYLTEETVVSPSGRKRVETRAKSIGYPYGAKPRLILAWLGREIKRQKSREIQLGSSLSSFMAELGLENPTGGKNGSITATREQLIRLFSARIALVQDLRPDQVNFNMEGMQIADRQNLWWDPSSPDQVGLFNSTVTLSERFFHEMNEHGVPVDMRALRALKGSPLELDLYCWLTYRYHSLTKRTLVPWEALQMQFGTEMASPRHFRWKLREALKSVLVVFPEAKLDVDSAVGLILLPSKTSVRKLGA